MTLNSKKVLLYTLFIFGGSAAGFVIGGYLGSNLSLGLALNNSISKDAQDLQSQLDSLRALRNGDLARSIEIIEAGIDDQLVIFDPHEPYQRLDETTRSKLDLAIESAYAYRQTYPRQSSRPHVDAMVEALFKKRGLDE